MLNIPIKTRAIIGQILAVLIVITSILHIFLYYIAIKYQNLYVIAYLVALHTYTVLFGKRNEKFIKIVQWFHAHEVFNETALILEEPVNKGNSIFCLHPHGIYTYGLMMNLSKSGSFFDELVPLGSRIALDVIPFGGLVLKLWGIEGVHAANFKRILQENRNVGFFPGGFEEATLTTKTENRVFIKSRKGFIKYALDMGSTIYPVFTFGENQLFNTFDKLIDLRLFLNKFKVVGTLFWSRFGLCPEPNTSLITVVGKGIKLPQIKNATKEQVKEYHSRYIQELIDLYNKYQPRYAPNQKLKIY